MSSFEVTVRTRSADQDGVALSSLPTGPAIGFLPNGPAMGSIGAPGDVASAGRELSPLSVR